MLNRPLYLVFLLWLPTTAQAFYQWQGDDASLELRSLFRGLVIAADNPNDNALFQHDQLISGGAVDRLMLDAQLSAFSFELHGVINYIDSELRTGGGRLNQLVDVERSDSLHWRFADEHADLQLDRINLQYNGEQIHVKLGRQPVNLAATYYFTPNDFFARFAAQTFFRTYKPGVDAARLDWQWDELSQLSLLTVLEYQNDFSKPTGWRSRPDWGKTSYLARASTIFGDFEWALLGGKVSGDGIIGLDFQGELFDWLGIRGEGHYRLPGRQRQNDDIKFSLGLEHRFENTLTIRLEQFYQRSGAGNADNYKLNQQSRSNNLYLARHYTALGASYEFTPLLTVDALWLANHNDRSNLFALYALYSLSDESELAFSANLPIGKQPDKGRLKSEFGSAPKSISLEYRLYF